MSLPKKDLIELIDGIGDKYNSIRNKMDKDGAGLRLTDGASS